jgi:hypothetical protein
MLAIWSPIISRLQHVNAERTLFLRKMPDAKPLDLFSRYFHLLGIDIMLSEGGRPMVLELNDKPSMAVTHECEVALKRDLVSHALDYISVDGAPCAGDERGNWERLLPSPPNDPNAEAIAQIIAKTASVFRTSAADRERPHYEERRFLERKGSMTFADSRTCQ